MSKTIGTLAYKVIADTEQLNKSAVLTKSQMRDVHKVMAETASPAAKMQEQFDRLTTIFNLGGISLEQYGQKMVMLKSSTPEAIEQQKKHSAAVAEARAITDRNSTAQERYAASLQKLNELKPHLSQSAYARELERLNGLLPNVIARENRRDAALKEGLAITRSLESEEERRGRTLNKLDALLKAKTISQETYNRALAREMQAKPATRPVSREIDSSSSGEGGIGSALLGRLGIAAAGYLSVSAAVSQLRNSQQQLSDLSLRATALGESAAKLKQTQLVLYQLGNIKSDETSAFVSKLAQRIGEAKLGAGEAATTFSKLHLNVNSLSKLSATEQLERVTVALRNLDSPSQRIALVNKLFEESGVKLLPVINSNAAALQAATEIAKQSSQATNAQAAAANQLGTSYRTLETKASALRESIGNGLNPAFSSAADVGSLFLDMVRDIGKAATGDFSWFMPEQQDQATNLHKTVKLTTEQLRQQREHAAALVESRRLEARALGGADARNSIRDELKNAQEESNRLSMGEEKARELKYRKSLGGNDMIAGDEQLIQDALRVNRDIANMKRIAEEKKQFQQKQEQDAKQNHEQALQRAEELHKKTDKNYELHVKLKDIENLRQRGMIDPKLAKAARDKEITEAAKEGNNKSASVTTASKGSAEEYKLLYDSQKREVDKQVLELRKHEVIAKQSLEELKEIRRTQVQVRTYP